MKVFIGCLLIFILNQICQTNGIMCTFTSCYLDDLLFFPIILPVNRFVQKFQNPNYTIPLSHIFYGVLLVSVIHELIAPAISSKYTGDWFDVVFYAAGAAAYYFLNQPSISHLNR